MKIFISHSSKDADYGDALVNLFTGVGISGDHIIFTSNDAYGIPIGQNIFDWLKNRITEKPYIIYLLSPEYYKSVACLNEMGAAWVIENKHTMIFTPNFKLDSYEFQNGAIDPREIGFYIDNYDKIIAFIESLRFDYNVTNNQVLISQNIRKFIEIIHKLNTTTQKTKKPEDKPELKIPDAPFKVIESSTPIKTSTETLKKYFGKSRFFTDLMDNKLKDEELLLIQYIIDTVRFKLFTGWQENLEIEKIKIWEDVNAIRNTLSGNYQSALNRFEMKKLIVVSAVTGSGKPKEMQIIEELQDELLDISDEVMIKIKEVLKQNPKTEPETDLW